MSNIGDFVKNRRKMGKPVASSVRERYCLECNDVFLETVTYYKHNYCPICQRNKLISTIVYDRDRHFGRIPANLKRYL